ncbi:MAG: PEGA domain-containing protein [Marinilabiliales bacterium]|nr:PEGA domain-containing protein [Marinilabiliales bacterium]
MIHHYTRLSIIFLLMAFAGTLAAQEPELNIKSFRKLDNDLDARVNEPRKDQNGDVCAILKVVTTQKGFTFDCGQIGIVKIVQKPSEIWVYVPYGVKRITISHPQLGILRDYQLPQNIEKASVYELVLISGTVITTVQETIVSQWLVITPDPADAMIFLNDKYVKNGVFQGKLKPGEYTYRVEAPKYYPQAGKVEMTNAKKEIVVKLKPAFGTISITSEPEIGAKVIIDGETLDRTTPCQSDPLTSGEHTIQVVKDLFQPATQKVMVQEGKISNVKLTMNPNYAVISIQLPDDAELFIDNQLKGKGNWLGHLGPGVYSLEARMERYRTAKKDIEVITGQSQEIVLKPVPLFGNMDLITNPSGARISLDGKQLGSTPYTLEKQLIGSYSLQISLPGYKTLTKTIQIVEGKNPELNEKLILESTTKGNTTPAVVPSKKEEQLPKTAFMKHKNAKKSWLIAGLATTAIGTYCYLQAQNSYQKYQVATTDAASLHQKVKTLDTVYPICFALAGFSAVELIIQSGKQKKAMNHTLGFLPFPVKGGAALSLNYKF